jgi:hypothetical protein
MPAGPPMVAGDSSDGSRLEAQDQAGRRRVEFSLASGSARTPAVDCDLVSQDPASSRSSHRSYLVNVRTTKDQTVAAPACLRRSRSPADTTYRPDVVILYHLVNPWGPSDDFYLSYVMDAPSFPDVGCGRGMLLHRASPAHRPSCAGSPRT